MEQDIKVLPQEGVSVEIGGETYNPAFPCGPPPRFSCQIIIFRQIMIGNKSYWRRHFKPTDNRFLIRRICCRWQHTPYTLSSYHKNLSKTQDGKVKYINIYINISDICRIYPTYASMRIGKYIRNGHWPSLFLTPSPTEEVLQSCVSVFCPAGKMPLEWLKAIGLVTSGSSTIKFKLLICLRGRLFRINKGCKMRPGCGVTVERCICVSINKNFCILMF